MRAVGSPSNLGDDLGGSARVQRDRAYLARICWITAMPEVGCLQIQVDPL